MVFFSSTQTLKEFSQNYDSFVLWKFFVMWEIYNIMYSTVRQAGPPKGPPCKEQWMNFLIESTSISRTWFENVRSKTWVQQTTWSKSLLFRNYFFLWMSTLESPNQKTELDGMLTFWCWFFYFYFFILDTSVAS